MTSLAIAEQIAQIILNNPVSQQSSTTEFDDYDINPDIQEISQLIKELLPNCNIIEFDNDYIIISYQNKIINCRYST